MKKFLCPPPPAIIAFFFLLTSVAKAQLNITVTTSDYHGYHISCFGMQNGSISLSVTGGTAPYTFKWSNQATAASINNLAAGYYSVRITDSSTNDTTLQFTLTQPEPLAMGELVAYEYANGFHVSMFGACNGSASAATTGGILPYTYFWKPGNQTIAAPNNLCAGENILTVTDMNGCEVRNAINLREPQRDDWTMTGNAYSNSSYNFIGTTDSTDLVFKTNNNERLRIFNNGDVKLSSLAGIDNRILTTDALGRIKPGVIIVTPTPSCTDPFTFAWQIKTNVTPNIAYTCWNQVGIGTDNPQKNLGVKGGARFFNFNNNAKYLDVETDGLHASINATDDLLINYYSGKNIYLNTGTTNGDVETGGNTFLATSVGKNVGIGTTSPSQKLEIAHDESNGGMALNRLNTNTFKNQISFQQNGLEKWAIGVDIDQNNYDNFYIWHGPSGSAKLFINGIGNIGIGTTTPSQKLEISHSDQYGGIAINQVSNQYYTSEIKFNYQGTQKWATGCYLGSSNNQSYFIWNHGLTTPRTAFYIDGTNNNTGIDTDMPTAKLDVNGSLRVRNLSGNAGKLIELDADGNFIASNTTSNNAGLWATDALGIYNMGKVFIGLNNCADCDDAPYKLYVEGGIMTRDIKVTADTPFPDYVFEKDYPLLDIHQLEHFIFKNKHLPDIPTSAEIDKNNGFEVGKMQTALLKKIEEQTLYIIDLQKQIDELKAMVKSSK